MNNHTEEIVPPIKMENMDGDGISDSDVNNDATDVFKIKALELLEKLQVELEEIKETYRREMGARNTEKEEQIKREQEMLKNFDELRKQMQLWLPQNTIIRLNRSIPTRQLSALPVRSSDTIWSVSSEEDRRENIEESDDFSFEVEEQDLEEDYGADEETVDNNVEEREELEDPAEIEEDDETEWNNGEEQEEMEDPAEIEEDDETERNNGEEQEEMEDPEESMENILEYSPVASEIELTNSTGRTADVKRKASSLLEADNRKKQRLSLVECPVCQDSFPEMTSSGKMLMVVPKCGHIMCSNCAMRIWSQRQKRCPKCKTLYRIEKLVPVYI